MSSRSVWKEQELLVTEEVEVSFIIGLKTLLVVVMQHIYGYIHPEWKPILSLVIQGGCKGVLTISIPEEFRWPHISWTN